MSIKLKALMVVVAAALIVGCDDNATVASHNLSKAADNFELDRRIVFYNGISGEYILTIEGKCSIKANVNKLDVTCKTGSNEFKKHFLGISDNVTYFSEQMEAVPVSEYRYRVIFKPEVVVPSYELNMSGGNQ